MNKQEIIDKIYEVVADKTLSFGCNIYFSVRNEWDYFSYITEYPNFTYLVDNHKIVTHDIKDWCLKCWLERWDEKKIIWHPVMIGDLLDYMQSNYMLGECIDLLWVRNDKRKPIDEQSEYCIRYVYDLITKQ